jgi:hypothetical protein
MADHIDDTISAKLFGARNDSGWVNMTNGKEALEAFERAIRRQEVEKRRAQIRLVVDNT